MFPLITIGIEIFFICKQNFICAFIWSPIAMIGIASIFQYIEYNMNKDSAVEYYTMSQMIDMLKKKFGFGIQKDKDIIVYGEDAIKRINNTM